MAKWLLQNQKPLVSQLKRVVVSVEDLIGVEFRLLEKSIIFKAVVSIALLYIISVANNVLLWTYICCRLCLASLVAQTVKNLPAMQETWVRTLGWEDPLEKGMATHSSILAWRSPIDRGAWKATQSMGSQRVGHDWATKHRLCLVSRPSIYSC